MEVKEIIPTGKFTKAQLELLKMFAGNGSEEDWEAIRDYAKKYFAAKLTDEMNRLFEENGWGDEKIDELSKAHFRTPYIHE